MDYEDGLLENMLNLASGLCRGIGACLMFLLGWMLDAVFWLIHWKVFNF